MQRFIALLRGINVGGHHKVPMKELKTEMENWGYSGIRTLLNSGNIIFESDTTDSTSLESKLGEQLEDHFGFPIPTRIRSAKEFQSYIEQDPFREVEVTKDIRLYVTFLPGDADNSIELPWVSEDQSFRIINIIGREIFSVLDLTKINTPKGMEILEKFYGKDITTRNWNTIVKIANTSIG